MPIYLSSGKKHAGKTSIGIGLILALKERGMNVGYIKPIGTVFRDLDGRLVDEDALHIKSILSLEDSPDDMSPVDLTTETIRDILRGKEKKILERAKEAFEKISRNKDIVLIEGAPDMIHGNSLGLSDGCIARELNSKVVLVAKYDTEISLVDQVALGMTLIPKEIFSGVIINDVPESALEFINETVLSFLERKGAKVYGIVPRDKILRAVPIRQILEELGGELLAGKSAVDSLVDSFLIGAMEVSSAIKYFRRAPNSAVITGGDRADIQMAAIETGVKCLVLTGNRRPSEVILAAAEERHIPVILVPMDTMSTVERMERMLGRLKVQSEEQMKRVKELVEKYVDLDALLQDVEVDA
ncbi:MAG: phosphotransacetylase family protein [Archaeoglobi archaeon]|nr:phosphotransacetylase family protein [Candidatus Mnemosynella sp.]MBC7114890.1 phosphotransacetylase family protein [Candidatus Mnemosynella bozhongmuii]